MEYNSKKTATLTHHSQGSYVVSDEYVIVRELKDEVENNAAPDRDVIKHGPIGRVECDLSMKRKETPFCTRALYFKIPLQRPLLEH